MRVTLCGFMSFLAKFGTRQTHGGGASGAGGICREGSAGRSNGWSGKENFRLISQWRAALPTRRECPILSAPEKVRERPPAPCRARRAAERGRSRGPLHSASTQMTSPSKNCHLMSAFALPREIPSEAAKRQRGKERFRPGGHRSTMGVAGPEPAMAGASAGSPL